MQGSLVNDRSDKKGRTIFLEVYCQAPKPVGPTVVEVTFHSKTICVDHCGTPATRFGLRHKDNLQTTDARRISQRVHLGV